MHVACRFIGGSAHCTFPKLQIPSPTVQNCSLFSSQLLGGVITQISPLRPHSTQPWTILSPSSSIDHWLLFFTPTEKPALSSLCCHLWTRSKTKLSRVRSQTPRRSCSTCSCRLSRSFCRLFRMLRQSSTTCKLPYKIHTTTKDRSIT